MSAKLLSHLIRWQQGEKDVLCRAGAVGRVGCGAAVITPGDGTGTLTIDGNDTQTSAGVLDINIPGPANYRQLSLPARPRWPEP